MMRWTLSWRATTVVAASIVVVLTLCTATPVAAGSALVPSVGYDVPQLRMLNCLISDTVVTQASSVTDATAATRDEQCDVRAYNYSLFAAVVPAAVVAVLVCLFVPLYYCSKYACDCCGGRRQSPNFCCPSNDLPAKYDKADLLRPLALAVVCMLLSVVALVWVCVSGARLQQSAAALDDGGAHAMDAVADGVNALTRSLTHVSYYDSTQLSIVEQSLLPLSSSSGRNASNNNNDKGGTARAAAAAAPTTTAGERYMAAQREALALLTRMHDAVVTPLHREATRFLAMAYLVTACGVMASVTLTLLGFCNCRRCLPMLLLFVWCVLAVLAWLGHGLYTRAHMLLADACREVDDAAASRANVLALVAMCNDTALQALAQASDDVLGGFARDTCRVLLPHCILPTLTLDENVQGGRVLSCPFVPTTTTTTEASDSDACAQLPRGMYDWLPPSSVVHVSEAVLANATLRARVQQMGYTCVDKTRTTATAEEGSSSSSSGGGDAAVCDVRRCANTCLTPINTPSLLTLRARDVASRATALHALDAQASLAASSGRSCAGVLARLVPPLVTPCRAMVTSAFDVRQGCGLLGLTALASLFVCVWGAKRFIAMKQALVPQYDT